MGFATSTSAWGFTIAGIARSICWWSGRQTPRVSSRSARRSGSGCCRPGGGRGPRDRDLARLRRVPGFWLRQLLRIYGFLDRHFHLPSVGRLDELRGGGAMVNDLSFAGAPPMRSYKPRRLPDQADSLNLTLGPIENKVVARGDQFASTGVMPLFLRADHRLVDAYQAGRFLAAVRDLLNHPERLDGPADQLSSR